jgi:alpha-tubulin suppressor-like RCC1 family protein
MKHLDLALCIALVPGCVLTPDSDDDAGSSATDADDGSTPGSTAGSSDDAPTSSDASASATAPATEGDDSSGNADDETSSTDGDDSGTDTTGDGLPSAVAIDLAVGRLHSCALTDAGAVRCWGYSNVGQLGNGAALDDVAVSTPVEVIGLDAPVVAIDTWSDHTCALTDAGAALCWGANDYGQLGDGTTTTSSSPVAVAGAFTAISAGAAHTCAITQSGGAQCWGHNDYGQLGDGTTDDAGAPLPVVGLTGVVAISAGRDHTCAVTNDGALHCWGGDTYGELGNGEPLSASHAPITVDVGADAIDVDAGDNDTCAITSTGAALCWGKNADGQLGNGESGTQVMSSTPQAVVGLDAGVTSISAGYGYTCAVASAAMLCWGDNYDGALGNGEGPGYESPVPIAVSGLGSGAAQIGACSGHACGRTDAGAVWCWGTNDSGALGDGTTDASTVPVEVISLP